MIGVAASRGWSDYLKTPRVNCQKGGVDLKSDWLKKEITLCTKPKKDWRAAEDITESRRILEKIILADRLASIGQMAVGAAHELTNLLTGVVGFSEMLSKRNDLPVDARKDLETINREAQRTANIAKRLLAFARKQEAAKELVDINSTIQEVL